MNALRCYLLLLLTTGLATPAAADDHEHPDYVVSGSSVIVSERNEPGIDPFVNKGGLLIVQVDDQGSRPVDKIEIEAEPQLLSLGQVRGINTDPEGRPLSGGGYTWVLYKASSDTRSVQLKVTVTALGKTSEWSSTVMITDD